MTTRLYYVPLPDAQATGLDEGVSSQVAVQGLLGQGQIAAQPISTDGVDLMINGQFRAGEIFSKKLARELESLGEGAYTDLPLFDDGDGIGNNRGYYETESVDVNPAHSSTGNTYEYQVNLTAAGTRSTRWREIQTQPSDVSHPFGNDQAAPVGLPAAARKVRWYDSDAGERTDAQPVATRAAEFGDVALYDANDTPLNTETPSLVYELDYDREGKVDVKVFDDRGGEKFASYDDGDGGSIQINQWTHVFHEAFDYEGSRVVDNGLLRLRFDEGNNEIVAWEWDDGNEEWATLSLGTSDYELFDADIRTLGPASIAAVVEFRDATQDPTEYYSLDMRLHRGWEYPLWDERDGEGGIPPGLVDLLDPIASSSAYDPGAEQGLRKRSEL